MEDEKRLGESDERVDVDAGWSVPPSPTTDAEPAASPPAAHEEPLEGAAPAEPASTPELDPTIPPPPDVVMPPSAVPVPEPPAPRAAPARTAALFPGEALPGPGGLASAASGAAAPIAPPGTADAGEPRRLSDALNDNVRLGKNVAPLWLLFGGLGTGIAVVALLLGLVLGLGISSAGEYADSLPAPAPSATDSAAQPELSPSPIASAPAASPSARSLTARAARGDTAALEELSAKAGAKPRAAQALLLAGGRAAARLREAQALRARLDADPRLSETPKIVAQLRDDAKSELTSLEALAAMAHLPGPISADLLYEVWTSTSERTPTTALAETLVYSEDVFPKASPALRVALELRRDDESRSCEQNLALVRRAADDGDRRVLPVLAKLRRKFGCGPRKKDDCYPCLHKGDDLKRAISQSRRRPVPKH